MRKNSLGIPCKFLTVVTVLALSSVAIGQEEAPDQFLEELKGEKALEYVSRLNARSAEVLQKDARFEPLRSKLLSIFDSKDKLTEVHVRLEYVYDFWKDDKNPRGLYRRTLLKEYLAGKRNWDIILDIDKFAAEENKNWVYGGANQFKDRILFSFSDGGLDAVVTREFDIKTRTWVTDGFNLPEAKNDISWVDEDTVMVGLATNLEEVTKSEYPMTVRLWKRGEKLEFAPIVFRGEKEDVSAGVFVNRYKIDGPVEQLLFSRWIDFFNATYWVQEGERRTKLNIPSDSSMNIQNGHLYLKLKTDWIYKEQTLVSGSLIRLNFKDFMKNKAKAEILFVPANNVFMEEYVVVDNRIFGSLMDDVKDKWIEIKKSGDKWIQVTLNLPGNSTIGLASGSDENKMLIFEAENFLEPRTRYLFDLKSNRISKLEQSPVRFDSTSYEVEQRFATSKDKTRVPYFVVSRRDVVSNGKNPTIIWAYGGFEATFKPYYSATIGNAWLEAGGVFVLANIRGGGEYGPNWHLAALKENRQRSYDDFFAVTEDLHKTGVTSPEKTGAYGGSNGGLLMGVALTQRPDLFKAIAVQVPLLDMLRYHLMPPGDSWTGEYGVYTDPKMKGVLEAYSPYQNLKPNVVYPEAFFMTARDDRVLPGHARRMAAKMERMGIPFLYYENEEGGHGGSANNEQSAKWYALQYMYFYQKLIDQN